MNREKKDCISAKYRSPGSSLQNLLDAANIIEFLPSISNRNVSTLDKHSLPSIEEVMKQKILVFPSSNFRTFLSLGLPGKTSSGRSNITGKRPINLVSNHKESLPTEI
jgi:hypothetical protein